MARPIIILAAAVLFVQFGTACSLSSFHKFSVGMSVRKEARIDLRSQLKPLAMQLKKKSPAPLHVFHLNEPEVDVLFALPKNKVLLGSVDLRPLGLSMNAFEPQYGPLQLIDLTTQKPVWTFERRADYRFRYSVASVGDVIVLVRRNDKKKWLIGLSAKNGKALWTHRINISSATLFDVVGGMMYVASPKTGILRARALDSGKVIYKKRFKVSTKHGLSLMRHRRDLLIISSAIEARTAKTGAGRWTYRPKNQPSGKSTLQVVSYSSKLAVFGDGLLALLSEKGRPVFEQVFVGEVDNFSAGKDVFLLETLSPKRAPRQLVAFDLRRKGRILWKRKLGDRIYSPILLSGSADAVFSSRKKIHVVKLSDGTDKFDYSLAEHEVDLGRLPDSLAVIGKNIIWMGRRNIIALNLKTGNREWHYKPVRPVKWSGFSLDFNPKEFGGFDHSPKARWSSTQSKWSSVKRIQYRHAEVVRATKDKVRSSNRETRKAAHGQRISAARHDLTAARMNINSEKMQANLDIVRTGISLQWQTYEALSSMVQGQMLVARQKRVNARRTAYASVHMNRLRDGLALFPLSWRKGDGWMLIDLKSGRWAEVATAVKEARLGEDVFVNAPAIALSAGTGMFYSKGIHLDPSTWRPDGRYVYGKTVRRALMGYQLKNLKFRSPKSYPSKSFTLTKREKRRILGETK